MMNLIKKSEKGFTLIELMIVVAIIGILAAIAIPQFAQYRIKAFNSAAASDAKTTVTVMEASYTDAYVYPTLASSVVGTGPGKFFITASVPINLSKGVSLAMATAPQMYNLVTRHTGGDHCFSANQLVPTVIDTKGNVAQALVAGDEGAPDPTAPAAATCN